jgi:hypothetical protein
VVTSNARKADLIWKHAFFLVDLGKSSWFEFPKNT